MHVIAFCVENIHTCHDVTENFLSEHDFIEFPMAGIVTECKYYK